MSPLNGTVTRISLTPTFPGTLFSNWVDATVTHQPHSTYRPALENCKTLLGSRNLRQQTNNSAGQISNWNSHPLQTQLNKLNTMIRWLICDHIWLRCPSLCLRVTSSSKCQISLDTCNSKFCLLWQSAGTDRSLGWLRGRICSSMSRASERKFKINYQDKISK
jgi:hypothetical protein